MDTAFWRSPDTALISDAFEHLYNAYHPPRPSSDQERQCDETRSETHVHEAPDEGALTGEPEGAFNTLRQHSEPDRAQERHFAHTATLRASTLKVSAEASAAAARQRLASDRKLACESSSDSRRARRRKTNIEGARSSGSPGGGSRTPNEVAAKRPPDEQHLTESAPPSKRSRKHGAAQKAHKYGRVLPAGEERGRSQRKLSHGCSDVTRVGPSEQLQQGQVKRKLDLTQGKSGDDHRVVDGHDGACSKFRLGGSAWASSWEGVSHDEEMAKRVRPQPVSGRGRTVSSQRPGLLFDGCESPVEAESDGCGKGSPGGYAGGSHSRGRVADLQGRKRETRTEEGNGRKWRRRLPDPSGMPVVGDEYSHSIVRGHLTGRCAAADRMVKMSSDLGITMRDKGLGREGSKADNFGWLVSRRGCEGGSAAAEVKHPLGSPPVRNPPESAPERKGRVANTGGLKDGGKQTPPNAWLMGGLFSPRPRSSTTPTPCPSLSTLGIRPQLAKAASSPRLARWRNGLV